MNQSRLGLMTYLVFMNVIAFALGTIVLTVPIHSVGDFSNCVTIDISSIITFSKTVEWAASSEFVCMLKQLRTEFYLAAIFKNGGQGNISYWINHLISHVYIQFHRRFHVKF